MTPAALEAQLAQFQAFRKAVIEELRSGEGDLIDLKAELRRLDDAIGQAHIKKWASEKRIKRYAPSGVKVKCPCCGRLYYCTEPIE